MQQDRYFRFLYTLSSSLALVLLFGCLGQTSDKPSLCPSSDQQINTEPDGALCIGTNTRDGKKTTTDTKDETSQTRDISTVDAESDAWTDVTGSEFDVIVEADKNIAGVGEKITFTCTQNPSIEGSQFSWKDSTGATEAGEVFSTSFETEGEYDVTCTVTTPQGANESASTSVEIGDTPPRITNIEANPQTGTAPLEVQFNLTVEHPQPEELNFEWKFGDGSGISNEKEPSHVYKEAQQFTASVIVTDKKGNEDTKSAEISVKTEEDGVRLTAVEVAAGALYNCALLNTGDVKCWGDNDYGQLGIGDQNYHGEPTSTVDLGSGHTAEQITVGGGHSCALLDNGSIKCWGKNNEGQLGLGDYDNRGDEPGEMGDNLPEVPLGSGVTASQVTAGGQHTCAVLDNGSVKCWGWNGDGQLGLGDKNARGNDSNEMGTNLAAVKLGSDVVAKQVTAGSKHNCVLLDNNTVKCWGNNRSNQLGVGERGEHLGDNNGEMGDKLPSLSFGSSQKVVGIDAGINHNCALLEDHSVKCWGNNLRGGLGLGHNRNYIPTGPDLPEVELGSGRNSKQISAGYRHTCSRLDNDSIKCWGRNNKGQLGLGDTYSRGDESGEMGDALETVELGTGKSASELTTGHNHTCVLLKSGFVKCWGHGNSIGTPAGNRGDEPGEMGDNLPTIDLGTYFPDE